MAKLKTGPMSNDELNYVADNYEKLGIDEVARLLNRSPDFVKKAIAQLPKRQQLDALSDSIEQLRLSPQWVEIKRTLMPDEIGYFESMWASYIRQFASGTDIVASDEMMIKDLILLDIFGNRAAAEKRDAMMQMDVLAKLIDKEQNKDEANRDMVALQNWREQLNGYRASMKSLTDTHINYQERKDQKLKQLKATREARFKEALESKQNIFALIRELDDVRSRQREGRMLAKVRAAADVVRDDWNELATYDDGTVDKPFLSPEGELRDEQRQRLQNDGQETNQ